MAVVQLQTLGFLSLYVGGADGTARQDGADAFSGECHMIKVLADTTVFTTLAAVDQGGNVVNMLTANNLTAKEFAKGDLVLGPGGGYISDYETTEETEYYKMMTSLRDRQTL